VKDDLRQISTKTPGTGLHVAMLRTWMSRCNLTPVWDSTKFSRMNSPMT